MEISRQIESNPSRSSFNPKGLDVEALDEIADERGLSRAEFIRQSLQDVVETAAEDDGDHADLHTPENPELRDAFETLLELSNHPLGSRLVTVGEARDSLYSQACPKAAVKRRLLEPLADLGFISVTNGKIAVHRRTTEAIEAAEQDAADELRRLEAATTDGPAYREVDPTQQRLLKYQRAGLTPPFELVAWTARRTLWTDEGGAEA